MGSLVTQAIRQLYAGVSRQPHEVRLTGQCEDALNVAFSVVDGGFTNRHGVDYIADLASLNLSPTEPLNIHTYRRDANARYLLFVSNGQMRVLRKSDGAIIPVTVQGTANDYLAGAASSDFAYSTIGDVTFVTNRNKVPALSADITPGRPFEALVAVRVGNYGKKYRITIADERGVYSTMYQTPDGGSASHAAQIDTSHISGQLETIIKTPNGSTYNVPTGMTAYKVEFFHFKPGWSTRKFVPGGAVEFKTSAGVVAATGTVHEWRPTDKLLVVKNISGTTPTDAHNIWHTYKAGKVAGMTQYDTVGADIQVVYPSGTNAFAVLPSDYEVQRIGNVIYFTRSDGDFTIHAEDGMNGEAMAALKGRCQTFAELPAYAPDGFSLAITGRDGVDEGDYYVSFKVEDKTTGAGVWREAAAPSETFKFDPATMPHLLIDNGAEFIFTAAGGWDQRTDLAWAERKVGSRALVLDPDFVGTPIRDIGLYRDRLYVTAGEVIYMSRAGDYFNFWPQSAMQVNDSDPFGRITGGNDLNTIRAAVPIRRTMFLSADDTQFEMTAQGTLTPKSASVDVTTRFETDPNARPVVLGDSLYLPSSSGDGGEVLEYIYEHEGLSNTAVRLTAHVPGYLPAPLRLLTGDSISNWLIVLGQDVADTIYTCRVFTAEKERVQTAWGKWKLSSSEPYSIMGAGVLDHELLLIVHRATGAELLRMRLQDGGKPGDIPLDYRLDYATRITSSATYVDGSATTQTRFTLPYKHHGVMPWAFKTNDWGVTAGEWYPVVADPADLTGRVVQIAGDHTGLPILFGYPFDAFVNLSQIYVRGESGQTETAGRLQVREMEVGFNSTTYFEFRVTPWMRTRRVYKLDHEPTVGAVATRTGKKRFPIRSDGSSVNIEVGSALPFPFTITSASWSGFYNEIARQG